MKRRLFRSTALAVTALILAVGSVLLSPSAGALQAPNQTFRLVFTADPSQEPGTVIAYGPITGVGAVRVTPGSGSGFLSTYEFAPGSISVAVTPTGGSFDPDFRSCTARVTSTSQVVITSGTGAYAGASGAGVATSSGFLVGERGPGGECLLGQAPPARGVEIATVNMTLVIP